jgi:type I restriction enzyme S subunit
LESQKQNKSAGATVNAHLPDGYRVTELGPLPEEWRVVRLGDVATVDWGNTSLTKKVYRDFGFPAYSAKGQDGLTDFYEHEGEAIIVSAIGARCGKCFYANGKWTAIKNTLVVKVGPATSDTLFFYYYLDGEDKWPRSGSGQPFIGIGKAKLVPIPLPPLSEQRAIAHVLRTVQRAREASEGVIAALRELKKSLMRHLFTYGPVPVDATDRVELQETEIGQIPTYWQVVPFGQTILRQRIHVGKVKQQLYKSVGHFPIVDQGQSIIAGYWDDERDVYQGPLPVIIFGDHTRVFKYVDFPFVCGADGTKVLLPDTKNFDSMFLFYAYTRLNIPSRGYNRHFRLLKEQKIPLPPLPEQREIARILRTVDRKIEAEEARKQALEALFKTLLHDLMTARRRLPAEFVAQFEKEPEVTA